MPFQKGNQYGRGRPPGSLNQQSRYLNDLYLLVAEELGEPTRNIPEVPDGEDDNDRELERGRNESRERWQERVREARRNAMEVWKWDGRDGVKGYLKWIAKEYPNLFMAGLTKILPNNLVITDDRREILDAVDLEIECRRRGISMSMMTELAELIDVTPKQIEHAKENATNYADSAQLRSTKTKKK